MNIISTEKGVLASISDKLLIVDDITSTSKFISVNPTTGKSDKKIQQTGLNIICIDYSKLHHLIAIATSDKQLIVYRDNFDKVKEWQIARAPSKVRIAPNGIEIVLADKTGDVYQYKINEDLPNLILGHLSIILDLQITKSGKFVITSDRDEKIRVSHYPNAYNIQSFCLGHHEFIPNIEQINDDKIVSISGDGTIRFWDFINGKQLGSIDSNANISNRDHIEKFTEEMRQNNIEIKTIPIIHLAFDPINNHIAILLYNINEIQFYVIESLDTLAYKFLTTLVISDQINSFCYSNDKFYVLSKKIEIFQFDGETKNYRDVKKENLEDLCGDFQDIDLSSKVDTIPFLYKKSFDNLQEYQERKKIRLETKS